MPKEKPEYQEEKEFANMAVKIVEKYPEVFEGIDVEKLCAVKITNKSRPETRKKMVDIVPVKMPVALHSPYKWYAVFYAEDWDNMTEEHQLALVAEALCSMPRDGDGEDSTGKVVPCDTHGYALMFRTFNSIDYLTTEIPNLLTDNVSWKP